MQLASPSRRYDMHRADDAAFARLYHCARGFAQALSDEHSGVLRASSQAVVEALRGLPAGPAAVWHPYGFFVLKVALLNDLGTLRLHVWPAGERRAQLPLWPVHCHRWHLASYVLAGEIENVWYQAEPGGAHPLYACTRVDGASVMTRTDALVSVREVGRQRLRAGSDYVVGIDTYHATSVDPSTFTATLALTRLDSDPYEAFVVGRREGDARYVYPRDLVEPAVVEAVLCQLAGKKR